MVPGAYSVGTQRAFQGCDRRKREGPGGCGLAGSAHTLEKARPGRVAGAASGTKRCQRASHMAVSGAASNGRIALRHSHAH
jgi:hypothetical protein